MLSLSLRVLFPHILGILYSIKDVELYPTINLRSRVLASIGDTLPDYSIKMRQEVFEVLVLLTEYICNIKTTVSRFILATIELLDRLIAFREVER